MQLILFGEWALMLPILAFCEMDSMYYSECAKSKKEKGLGGQVYIVALLFKY